MEYQGAGICCRCKQGETITVDLITVDEVSNEDKGKLMVISRVGFKLGQGWPKVKG